MSTHSSHEKEVVEHHDHHTKTGLTHVHHAKDVGDAKVVKVQNATLAAAAAATQLNPWSKESLILYWCCFIAFLCSCANGYDGSLMTAINGMEPYTTRFTKGNRLGEGTSLIFSMYNVGSLIGPWFGGPLSDKLGRRGGMFIGGLVIIVGTAVISSATKAPQFIAGRFFLGFGVSILTSAAPSYIVEVAPPQWRGRFTAFYNCGWFGGSVPAAGITLGTSKLTTDWSYRIPLICQAVPSGVVCLAVWFLPESPRWLVSNGRDAEARAFLIKYHGANREDSPLVEMEWNELKDNIKLDASDKRFWDYSELFKTHSARWRFFMVVLMGVFGQFSGNGLGYFNLDIYKALGYNTEMQFNLNLISSFTQAFCALCGVSLADRMPRRKVLYIGTFICACMLALNGGFSKVWDDSNKAGSPNLAAGRTAVAFYFLFGCIYSFTYTPLQALYPVECVDNATRAKGMSMYGVVVGLFGFINTYATPIALKNIEYRYVFIFVGWDVIESVVWYFFAVETVGRSLEQLEEIFSAPNPVKASTQKQTIAVRGAGDVVIVDED